MDTRTRTGARIVLATLTTMMLASGPNAHEAASDPIDLGSASPQQRAIADWALERYELAGLELPALDIVFHDDPSGCRDNSGFYSPGRLDVCSSGQRDYARKVVIHELAHAWIAANLSSDDREGFLRLRGVEVWNSWDVPWGLRGFEQAAEIITWAIGDRSMRPLLQDRDPVGLATAYEALTGLTPPGTVGPVNAGARLGCHRWMDGSSSSPAAPVASAGRPPRGSTISGTRSC